MTVPFKVGLYPVRPRGILHRLLWSSLLCSPLPPLHDWSNALVMSKKSSEQ